jgi:hypothetical protein
MRWMAHSGIAAFLILSLVAVTACQWDSSSQSSSANTGTTNSPATPNTVIATPSISGRVTVVSGGTQTVTATFTASDSQGVTRLAVTSGLGSLPSGWTGPPSFSCESVSTGSGCVLNLVFAPQGATSGTLTVGYAYTDATGVGRTGTLAFTYLSTSENNVTGTASPAGQIVAQARAGGQTVTITFTTDDGRLASKLAVTTDLSALPVGWHSAMTMFACETVSVGNGCQLTLDYVPTAVDSGILTLAFKYADNSGAEKSGSAAVSYVSSSDNNIVGTVAPSGQITALVGASQVATVTFTTDDGASASAFSITSSLAALPSGWSSAAASLACASVATGNGCELILTYTPTSAAAGTLQLTYGYTNDEGIPKTGTVNIPYTASVHDNVSATVAPSGQVNAVVGTGNQAVSVTFDTDDGAIATGLTLGTSLASLPSGWSASVSSFTCSTVSSGNSCVLGLDYAPSAIASGTLALGYSYTDNAGTAKTGTVSIPYASTAHDNVVGTAAPSGPIDLTTNSNQTVAITFATDDGNPASGLSVTSGLSTLPTGWTGPAAFTCAALSSGTGCQLSLTYAPTAADSGTVTLAFGYVDNAGAAKTGSVNIPFSARVQHVYVVDGRGVSLCAIAIDHTLTGCVATGGLSGSNGIAFSGNFAYVASYGGVQVCAVATDGTLSGCTGTGSNFYGPYHVAVHGAYAYVTNVNYPPTVTYCVINSADGTLSNCATTISSLGYTLGITVGEEYAYISSSSGATSQCGVNVDATLSGCTATASGINNDFSIALSGSVAFIANSSSGLATCAISASTGNLTGCTTTSVNGYDVRAVAVGNGYAYVGGYYFDFFHFAITSHVYLCAISGQAVSNCLVSDGGSTLNRPTDIVIH